MGATLHLKPFTKLTANVPEGLDRKLDKTLVGESGNGYLWKAAYDEDDDEDEDQDLSTLVAQMYQIGFDET